jgi:MoaA/NifB/PqqE/SkfB family radical SAM enzyme
MLHELAVMRRHSFDMLIFFVTGQCNSRCRHCFYWRNTGPEHKGPSLENVRRLSRSLPAFRTLLLSGGEPTLRSDLAELVEIFRENSGIQTISVPTNGLVPRRVVEAARQIAQIDPQLSVTFNVSLDGFAPVHDAIRGVPGGFERAMQTLKELQEIGKQYPNFQALVNTVICAENYEQVVPFAAHIRSTGLADGHFFELVRGDPPEASMKSVPPEALRRIYRALVPIQEAYLARTAWRKKRGLFGLWRRVTDVGNLILRYRHQWSVYAQGRRWRFPCMAGEGIGVIDYDGRLRVCELRDASVDLSECGYDFAKAWDSPVIRGEAASAKTHQCDCTHTCFLGVSMRQNFVSRFLRSPWLYMLYRLRRLW